MDNISYKILALLQHDSRMTYTKISQEINLSIPSVKERIDKMVDMGVIKNNTIEIDYKKLGRNISAIICVDVRSSKYNHFVKFCSNNPYITDFYRVIGLYNAIIHVSVEDTDGLENLINTIKNYGTCQTSVVTSTYFRNKILTIDNS